MTTDLLSLLQFFVSLSFFNWSWYEEIIKLSAASCRSVVFCSCCLSCAAESSLLTLCSSTLSCSHCKERTVTYDCSNCTVPWNVLHVREEVFSLVTWVCLLHTCCKMILKYSKESESSFNTGDGNILHFSTWESSLLLSNNNCWWESWVWDFPFAQFNKTALLQTKQTEEQDKS